MDFIGIVRSLEELLYEVMTWLIFVPRTLWRILVNPTRMTLYSEEEQDDPAAARFEDALSPPLLLMLTLVLLHGFELAADLPVPQGTGPIAEAIFANEKSLLMFRALVFSLFPLVIATQALRRQHRPIDRLTLRVPFYAQCYLVAPFALLFSLGSQLARMSEPMASVGGPLAFAAFAWYLWAETRWFARQFRLRPWAAAWAAASGVMLALVIAAIALVGLAATMF